LTGWLFHSSAAFRFNCDSRIIDINHYRSAPDARAGRSGVMDPQDGFFALRLLFDSMNGRRESGPDTSPIKHHGSARALPCGVPTFDSSISPPPPGRNAT
jgi:hypothetical protein